MGFWDFLWLLVWTFFFVMYLMVLFQIIGDLFRDHGMSGWLKAVWIIALLLVPFLSALIYLIARGRGMAERQARQVEGLVRPRTSTSTRSPPARTRPKRSHRRRRFSIPAPSPRTSSPH